MHIPAKLIAFAKRANAQAWLATLPTQVGELARKWNLEVGRAYPNCGVSFVAPATQNGTPVVLKVQWPHPECRYEADALQAWNGHGAVSLLASDRQRQAMLLERCTPGEHLAGAKGADVMRVMIELLPRLWKTAAVPFTTLREEAKAWQSYLYAHEQPIPPTKDKSLIDAAAAIISELADSQGDQVLVHQDLHGDNVLSAQRESWLAIDPKPLIGEREFALSPIIRSVELGPTKVDLLKRLDQLTEAFSLDRQRASGWAAAQAIAWSGNSDNRDQHYQIARWLLAKR